MICYEATNVPEGKVVLKHHTIKMYRRVDLWLHTHILNLGLDGGQWAASHPSHFTSGEIAPGIHWTGHWAGPRAGLDAVAE